MIRKLFPGFTWKRMLLIILGAAIVSFGLYNIHQQCASPGMIAFKELLL